jgi:SAM-dependent methyltransferase
MKRLPFWRRPYSARRILDVGGGHNPFHHVTHVVEIDLTEGTERCGNRLLVPKSAKLIVGDVASLPFQPRSFDFVYASHVLEHVVRPESACQELMRIGFAGYIETPSPLLEQGLALTEKEPSGTWVHKWLVFQAGPNLVVFEPKTPETVSQFCSCPDGAFIRDFYQSLDFGTAHHYLRKKAKTTFFFWKSSFLYEVRERTLDCQMDKRPCRFQGMRRALLENCNDLVRARRLWRLRSEFPVVQRVFRKYGHRTLFFH